MLVLKHSKYSCEDLGNSHTNQSTSWTLQVGIHYVELVMGLGQIFFIRVGSIFSGSGWVSHLWFGFGFGKFPPKNFSIFFFPSDQKNHPGSGQKVPRVKGLFTAVQKYARVGSGPISMLNVCSMLKESLKLCSFSS